MKILLLALLFAFGPASRTYELGPEIATTRALTTPERTQWIAYGWVYPAGTFTHAERACVAPDAAPIGSYAVYVRQGEPSEHVATYRLSINGQSWIWEGVIKPFTEDSGAPGSVLYPLARMVRGVPVGSDGEFAAYTARSGRCFGGRVQLFIEE